MHQELLGQYYSDRFGVDYRYAAQAFHFECSLHNLGFENRLQQTYEGGYLTYKPYFQAVLIRAAQAAADNSRCTLNHEHFAIAFLMLVLPSAQVLFKTYECQS